MNLRLDSKAVRIRLSVSELNRLGAGEALLESLPLPQGDLQLRIEPRIDLGTDAEPFQLVGEGLHLTMSINPARIQELREAFPAKNALSGTIRRGETGFAVFFEVDLHSRQ